MAIQERDVKQAVRRLPQVDSYFGSRYSFSPYRGCTHRCVYCDGRAERYYVEGDFEKDIQVRRNLPEKLKAELPKLRERGFILAGSGVTDPYQPLEKREELTARGAEILGDFSHPVLVTTKSALVSRDLERWKKVNRNSRFLLLLTMANLDEDERRIFEPGASPVEDRLETAARFKAGGITVGAMLMPLLPYLWDSPERLAGLLDRLAETGVDFVLPGSLTLRPGVQKETYLAALAKNYPGLIPAYEKLYRENRPSGAALSSYTGEVYRRLAPLLRERELPFLMPHRVFKGKISLADETHLLIQHLRALYGARGVDTRPLKKAEADYLAWLLPRRKEFNRRSSLPADHLDCQVREAFRSGGMEKVLANSKLFGFLEGLIAGGGVLNYVNLKAELFPQESPQQESPQQESPQQESPPQELFPQEVPPQG